MPKKKNDKVNDKVNDKENDKTKTTLETKLKKDITDHLTKNIPKKQQNLLDWLIEFNYNNLLSNLQNNTELKEQFLSNKINIPTLLTYKADKLNPDKWTSITKKYATNIENKNKTAITDMYTCRKCKNTQHKISHIQTRGLDEPITTFLTCTKCETTFKL